MWTRRSLLFSSLFSRLQRGTRVLCGTKVTVTKRSCSHPPSLPLPPSPPSPLLTCRDYVCVYTSGSVFTLHPPLPPSNQLFLLISCSPPPTPPPRPLGAADFCTRSPCSNQQMACQASAQHRAAVCPAPATYGGGGSVPPSDGCFPTHFV